MLKWLKKREANCEIAINVEKLETRVAVVEKGRLEEFMVEHPGRDRLVGAIFKGRIQNLEHDLQAAFVDIGLKKNAFLHYWDMMPENDGRFDDVDDGTSRKKRPQRRRRNTFSNEQIAARFPPGSEIVVQVAKDSIGSKGPRVTASLSIPGRYLVMMPGTGLRGVSRKIGDAAERQKLRKNIEKLPLPENVGIIVRTAGVGASKRGFVRDLRNLLTIWEDLQRNIREKPAPSCVYEEPDLAERVVRDWLTEEIDRIVIDDPETFERIRDVAARFSRRARGLITRYDGPKALFDQYGIEPQIEEVFQRKVQLKSGGHLVFDETEALIAIDVNTGRHKSKDSQENAILTVNLEAAEEVARQLRLRNVGGQVIIDFIDMKSRKHQNQVTRAVKTALKRDKARTHVLPISDLGLMEMTRQRAEESILSQAYQDCPYCRGRGSVRSPLAMSVELQRQISAVMRRFQKENQSVDLQIAIHPSLLERLRHDDEPFLIELEKRFGTKLVFKSEPLRHVESFQITDAGTGKVLYAVGEPRTV